MNIVNAKVVLKAIAEKKSPVSVCFWGKHGIAKSAMISQVAKELGYGFIPLILSQREAVDLLGVPDKMFDDETKMSVTEYHPPKWFAQAVYRGKLIIFLDELNRARPEVIKAAFELVNERRLNNMKLRDDVIIVVACNPADGEGRYQVTEFDEAMIDRFMHIHVKPDLKVWGAWAKEKREDGSPNIHEDITDFLLSAPNHAWHVDKGDEDFPVEIKHSFRSWERAHYIHSLGLPHDLELECLQGVIGGKIALAFLASINDRANKPLTIEEIYEFSKETEKRLKKWDLDNNESRQDVLKECIKTLHNAVKDDNETVLKHAENVMKFLMMIPLGLFTPAIAGIYERPGWAPLLLGNKKIKDKMHLYGSTVEPETAGEDASKAGDKKTVKTSASGSAVKPVGGVSTPPKSGEKK